MNNWDATICSKTNKIGLGVVVRDHMGSVLTCISSAMNTCSNPLTEKFICSMERMEIRCWFGALGFWSSNTGRCSNPYPCSKWCRRMQSLVCNLVKDVKMRLKRLSRWTIKFIHRDGNQVEHYLTKHGLLLNRECIWINKFLDVIENFVLQDSIFNEK